MRLELFRADELLTSQSNADGKSLVGRSSPSLEELDGLPGLFGHVSLAFSAMHWSSLASMQPTSTLSSFTSLRRSCLKVSWSSFTMISCGGT